MLPPINDLKETATANIVTLNLLIDVLNRRIHQWEKDNGEFRPRLTEPEFYELVGRVMLANEEMSGEQTVGMMVYQRKVMNEGIATAEAILDLPDDATLDMMPTEMIHSYNSYMKRHGNAGGL